MKYQFYEWGESISMYDKNAKWISIILKEKKERKKESLWKIEGERLKWHLARESTIGNNKTYCIQYTHVYIIHRPTGDSIWQ